MHALIDSGANKSILNYAVYKALDENCRPPLQTDSKATNLYGATGKRLRLHGTTTMTLNLQGHEFRIKMIVADLDSSIQCLLGIDFLRRQNSYLDLRGGILRCGEIEITLQPKPDACCHFVLLDSSVTLPAGGFMDVKGFVDSSKAIIESSEALIETYESVQIDGVLPVRSLVEVHGNLPFSFPLLNVDNSDKRLLPLTPIALITSVSPGDIFELEPSSSNMKNDILTNEQNDNNACGDGCGDGCGPVNFTCSVSGQVQSQVKGHSCQGQTAGAGVQGSVSDEAPGASSSPISEDQVGQIPQHLISLYEDSIVDLSTEEALLVKSLLIDYADVFSGPSGELGLTHLTEHVIDTGDHEPVRMPFRRFSSHQRSVISEQVQQMLEKGVLKESVSAWNNPLVLIRKRDGSYRVCNDLRYTNAITKKDSQPLKNCQDLINALEGSKYFSSLDLTSGFWQVPLSASSKEKTSFSTPDAKKYEYNCMPFGLCNAPGTFERLMQRVLTNLEWRTTLVFLDDICVHSRTITENISRLREVFDRLRYANLKVKVSKTHLLKREISFLGHKINEFGVAPDPSKIEAVSTWPRPRKVKDIRSFIGLCSYYRKFIDKFSEISAPLTNLTRKEQAFIWDKACQESFDKLKVALTSSPVLSYPSSRIQDVFILDTDASDNAIGCCLSQMIDGEEKVISYASKKLNEAQSHYCATFKELFAVQFFTHHMKSYIAGLHFIIRTDHRALLWLNSFRDTSDGLLARWISKLSQYDYKIVHRAGRAHSNADSLSRRPINKCRRVCKSKDCPDCCRTIGLVLDTIPEVTEFDMSADHDLIGRPSSVRSNVAGTGGLSTDHDLIDRSSSVVPGNAVAGAVPADHLVIDGSSSVISDVSLTGDLSDNHDSMDRSSGAIPDVEVTGDCPANPVLIDRSSGVAEDLLSDTPEIFSGGQCLNSNLHTGHDLIDSSSTVIPAKSASSQVVSNVSVASDHSLCASSENTEHEQPVPNIDSNSFEACPVDGQGVSSNMDDNDLDTIVNWIKQYPSDKIIDAQSNDVDICIIVAWMKEGRNVAPDRNTLMPYSAGVKSLCAQWANLVMRNGILCRRWPDKVDPTFFVEQMIAPLCFRDEIFNMLHGSRVGGHFGINKTLKTLKDRFWWPQMKGDVQEFCKCCVPCSLAKGHPVKQSRMTPMVVSVPFDRVALDLCGPLPPSGEDGQYLYILILVDYATKMIVLAPLRTKSAEECADVIVSRWVAMFGAMRILHGDRDPSWLSQVFKEMCKLLEVSQSHTSPYHPSSDGLVERTIKTISQLLKILVNKERNTWSELLPFVELAYRSTPHDTTMFSPFRMCFGREMAVPADLLFKTSPRIRTRFPCTTNYVRWLRNSLEQTHEMARKHMGRSSERQRRSYNLNVKPQLDIGDFCYRFKPIPGKLQRLWSGPYKVHSKASEVNYYIQESPGSNLIRVHMDHLKPHFGRTPSQWRDPVSNPVPLPISANSSSSSERPSSGSEQDAPVNSGVDRNTSDSTVSGQTDNVHSLPSPKLSPRRSKRQRRQPSRLDW